MKTRLFLSSILVLGFAVSLHGQVAELWRTTVSLSSEALYSGTTATLDHMGNTIVGGMVADWDASTVASFVAKFDPQGHRLWEYSTDYRSYLCYGVDDVRADVRGNIFATIRSMQPYRRTLDLVKCSPDGDVLWRLSEPWLDAGDVPGLPQCLRLDSRGNAFFLVTSGRRLVLSKVNPDGQVLWRNVLPGMYPVSDVGLRDSLAVTPEDGVIVVGGLYPLQSPLASDPEPFATRFDSEGNVLWRSADYKGRDNPVFYSSVLVGSKGTTCAAAMIGYVTTFSGKGKPIHTELGIGGQLVGITSDGGFMLQQANAVRMLNANGTHRWTVTAAGICDELIGVVADGNDGWLLAGGSTDQPDALTFARLDRRGNRSWHAAVGPFSWEWNPFQQSCNTLLRAPDGTLRVVIFAPFGDPPGTVIAAFALE